MIKKLLFLPIILIFLSASAQLNITFRSQMTNAMLGTSATSNICGYVDGSGNEYALVGSYDGMKIVDVTNPVAPVLKFTIPGNPSSWREIKTFGSYAYVTTEATSPNAAYLGIQIVNLSSLPATMPSYTFWRPLIGATYMNKAHALHIEAGYLYLFGTNISGGTALIANLNSNPWAPTYMGMCMGASSNYVHDGYVRNDTLYAGHIYAGYFAIWNVTNKAAPVLITTQTTPGAFTHNTWLTNNSRVLLTTDEVSNSWLASYDVADPWNISELDRIQSQNPGSGSIVHNTHVVNDYAVSSWYRDGVTIVDASRKGNLITTGWYDCNTVLSGNGFNSVWGVYPFLPSGNLLISDIEGGLFVLTPNYVRGCYLEGMVTDSITTAPLNAVTVQILSTSLTELSKPTGQYKTGTAIPGTYSIQFSKAGYYTKIISGVTLTNGVLTVLNCELVPMTTITVTGTVKDNSTGLGIPGALVKFENATTTYNATANGAGNYSISGFFPGTYDITAGKWLYKSTCTTMNVTAMSSPVNMSCDTGIYDDFTFNYAWVVTGNATTGAWTRGVPVGTTYSVPGDANPGVDASADCSKLCYVTGNGGGTYGFDDVDNGTTTLTSPLFSLSNYSNPYINYSRWFFNIPSGNPANDTLCISLSNGITTVALENVIVSTPPGMSQWVNKSYKVSSYLLPTANMRLIVYTADQSGTPNTLEAGFDHFDVTNPPSPLPVSLALFEGMAMKSYNLLHWVTLSETDNEGFIVERSNDGMEFYELSFIKGYGTTTGKHEYDYLDYNISRHKTFYRLKQLDKNGGVNYSQVVIVLRPYLPSDPVDFIAPNPVINNFRIHFSGLTDEPLVAELYDVTNRLVLKAAIDKNSEWHTFNISHLRSGLYTLRISGQYSASVHRILKQ